MAQKGQMGAEFSHRSQFTVDRGNNANCHIAKQLTMIKLGIYAIFGITRY